MPSMVMRMRTNMAHVEIKCFNGDAFTSLLKVEELMETLTLTSNLRHHHLPNWITEGDFFET